MKREIKTEKILMDKDQLEAIIKKYEVCKFCNKLTKVIEIIGLTIGATGLFAKSFVLGGTGLGIAGLSRIARTVSNHKQDKVEKEIRALCGKTIRFLPKTNKFSQTKEENYEIEK